MKIHGLAVGPLEENCWILHDEASGQVVLVDPGDESEAILAAVERTGGTLVAIWITHAHFDHIGAVAAIRRAMPDVPVALHPADLPLWRMAGQAAARWGVPFEAPGFEPEIVLADGDTLTIGLEQFAVQHVPGHAPGHVMFVGDGVVCGGDLLFAGSIGRTDLPLCDPVAMQRSLARAAELPPETVVYPGHGPTTTIGRERQQNPFLSGAARVVGA